jgi:predicted metal-dependent peptidase
VSSYPAALPAWESRPVRVGILIDTSGSMGDTDLREALEETVGILRTVDGRVRVASADYDLSEQSIVEDIRAAPDVKLIGGGGTDMGAALIRARRYPVAGRRFR